MGSVVQTLQEQIIEIVNISVPLAATYDYPEFTLGKSLPALTVVYDGFVSVPESHSGELEKVVWQSQYDFELALYFSIDSRNLKATWLEMLARASDLIWAFRDNHTLNGFAVHAEIDKGLPVIQIPMNPKEKPRILGHTFSLMTKVAEEDA
jgi:hypothetical protein